MTPAIARAVDILRGDGVIACPTEGVFGLSCLPDSTEALQRLLSIKQRDAAKGLILIAANAQQLSDWIAVPVDAIPEPRPEQAITWIVPAAANVSELVRGEHSTIAVRVTTNPTAAALCRAADSPLTSTSANLAGQPTITDTAELHRAFASRVDYIVAGDCGPASGPSSIIILESGKQLR
jgi:L-threonylcarbamoyladenylate synthase